MLKPIIHRLGRAYIDRICRSEYQAQRFNRINERPVEYSFVFRKLAEINPATVLDVGTGKTALPQLMRTCGFLVSATDNIVDYWPDGMINRHYHVINDNIADTKITQKFDVITCVSVLEHIDEHDEAVQGMLSLLKPQGHLLLTCPYSEAQYIDNVYELDGSSYGQQAPYKTRSYSRKDLERWLNPATYTIQEQEYWRYWDGEYWTVGNQILPPEKASRQSTHQHSCIDIQRIC